MKTKCNNRHRAGGNTFCSKGYGKGCGGVEHRDWDREEQLATGIWELGTGSGFVDQQSEKTATRSIKNA